MALLANESHKALSANQRPYWSIKVNLSDNKIRDKRAGIQKWLVKRLSQAESNGMFNKMKTLGHSKRLQSRVIDN